jgi:hypothetical protein
MPDRIIQSFKNIEAHADALMKIPANEQHIASIQSVVSIALLEIKRALEQLYQQNRTLNE